MVSYRASVPAGHAGRGVALSYRALAPGGAGIWHRTCTGTSGGVVIVHYTSVIGGDSATAAALTGEDGIPPPPIVGGGMTCAAG